MVVLKDIQNDKKNIESINMYKLYNKDRTEVDYSDNQKVKPMKSTINLIENQRISGLKNAPIRGSDKRKANIIEPYQFFKGAKALPTFKNDLKWHGKC